MELKFGGGVGLGNNVYLVVFKRNYVEFLFVYLDLLSFLVKWFGLLREVKCICSVGVGRKCLVMYLMIFLLLIIILFFVWNIL